MWKTWKQVLFDPFNGFKDVSVGTKVGMPTLMCALLAMVITALLVPVMTHPAYQEALVRMQVQTLEAMGQELSEAQVSQMEQQLSSPGIRTWSIVSSVVGSGISVVVGLLLVGVLVWVGARVGGVAVRFRHAYAVGVFAYPVLLLGSLIREILVVSADPYALFRNVRTSLDLGYALQPPLSLAAVLTPSDLGHVGYALVNAATDIFSILYLVLLYAGLVSSVGVPRRKAVLVTVLFYVVFVAFSVVPVLFVPGAV
ncbi:YIP1 family protein [Spirochaeta thermophila]|uniref:Yip1 domain-containing protein n=1 Tax=Winmispira thermophila (strain ATCC 49972 / DSM 6192 / RI 19.B1) TaxID=665571 RepID=E0RQ19_WINT6|nr:YIP1 family protein [Spirochaeta thermophila]ADN02872.1 hypothetical protein STHERM_c19370 [Spirochaeta thermophila DSM 6192]